MRLAQPRVAPRHGLSEEELGRYRRDGFVAPVDAFEADEAAGWLRALQAIEAERAGRLPPALNAKPHLLLPWLWDIVHDPRVVDRVECLLGSDLLCWGTSFISKSGHDDRYVSWHQDATHWQLCAPLAVTAWIALSDSVRETGCVRALPGTQATAVPHEDSRDPNNILGRRERVVGALDETAAVDLELRPGQMSLHHPLLIHGSPPNRSGRRRIGFAIRYIPAHLSQIAGQRNFATLVRGRDYSTFERERRPEGPFHPNAVAHHRQALRSGMAVIFGSGRSADGGRSGSA